jgi:hypothetical protein
VKPRAGRPSGSRTPVTEGDPDVNLVGLLPFELLYLPLDVAALPA